MTTPKDRPILFSAPMVRAILAGQKTQTRRVMKLYPNQREVRRAFADERGPRGEEWVQYGAAGVWVPVRCKYGVPGGRLWVREAWRTLAAFDVFSPRAVGEKAIAAGYKEPWAPIEYLADGTRAACGPDAEMGRYRPPMFMPRWASRLALDVTEIRAERVQDASDADIAAEGVTAASVNALWDGASNKRRREAFPDNEDHPGAVIGQEPPRELWRIAWTLINGREPWLANPWVWVVGYTASKDAP